jgi:hypothetical protein
MRRTSFDAAQAGRWMQQLGAPERAEMARVLTAFGVADYAVDDPFPVSPRAGAATSSS